MLVLTRRKGEEILLGDNISIIALGIGSHGEQRLGIVAPKDVSIVRKEIAWKFDEDGNPIKEKPRRVTRVQAKS